MTQMTIMTGEDRRRKWPRAERERILAAAFAPGAVVTKVARQFDVASSLIYTWRRQAAGIATRMPVGFSPAILIEQAKDTTPEVLPLSDPAPAEPVAITVEFSAGVRVIIDATAPTALVTATLLALQ
jgi:transposase